MTYWKEWAKAAGIRAIRTAAEAMLAYIGTGALVLGDVNWIAALSAGAMGAVTAVLLIRIAGSVYKMMLLYRGGFPKPKQLIQMLKEYKASGKHGKEDSHAV